MLSRTLVFVRTRAYYVCVFVCLFVGAGTPFSINTCAQCAPSERHKRHRRDLRDRIRIRIRNAVVFFSFIAFSNAKTQSLFVFRSNASDFADVSATVPAMGIRAR